MVCKLKVPNRNDKGFRARFAGSLCRTSVVRWFHPDSTAAAELGGR